MITKCSLFLFKDKNSKWYLDVFVFDSGRGVRRFHSLTGEHDASEFAFDDSTCYFTLALPTDPTVRAARKAKIQSLLAPHNWDKVMQGCKNKTKATSDWLESYLGITTSLLSAAADLDIP